MPMRNWTAKMAICASCTGELPVSFALLFDLLFLLTLGAGAHHPAHQKEKKNRDWL
jgi:hypothetical protein